jgi:hypothetical protein
MANLTSPKLIGIRNVTNSPLPTLTAGHILPLTFKGGEKAQYPDGSGYWRVS